MKQQLSRQERRKAWIYAAAIVAGLLLIALLIWWVAGWPLWAEKASLPETSAVVTEAAANMDTYLVDAAFDPEARTLTATQTMTLRNRWQETPEDVTLRSYSGAYRSQDTSPAATEELFAACYGNAFSPGGLTLDSVQVNGEAYTPKWADDAKTVLTLPLSTPWLPNSDIRVTLTYTVTIPKCASRFGVSEGIYTLGNVFPTLAVREDGAWRTDAYIAIGDPFLSECANWTVRLALPKAYSVASTAWAEPVISGDTAVYTMTAQAVRDFGLVISDRFRCISGMAGENAMVVVYAQDEGRAREMLRTVKQAIACFETHYGDYVYPTLTVAEVSFPFGGMEYPRMVMISGDAIRTGGDTLNWTLAHEVAHQWWYGQVGSDSWYQAWQDESLCEYALMDFIGATEGESARSDAVFSRIETALRITLPRDVTPGSPIDYFSDLDEYTQVVYRRGAALWMALETHLGKASLDDFLRAYQETYRFRIAARGELNQLLNDFAGQDLTELMIDYLDTAIIN